MFANLQINNAAATTAGAVAVRSNAATLRLKQLDRRIARLQRIHGSPGLRPISGAGCVARPRIMFVFMNPTARNVSARRGWRGLRAPWLGTRTVWQLFLELGLLDRDLYARTQQMRPDQWTPELAEVLYLNLAQNGVYVTNLAKCTQADAAPLSDSVFREYMSVMHCEVLLIQPATIVTFGNQVSSLLLNRPISVSNYADRHESVTFREQDVPVYPTYYPVGQGLRNMPLAIRRLRQIL